MSKFNVGDKITTEIDGESYEGIIHSVCHPDDPDRLYTVAMLSEGVFLRVEEEDIQST